jgi:hypothetical protein
VAIAALAAALFVLNGALTFESLWPTPAIWWRGGLSIELAVVLVLGAWLTRDGARVSRSVITAVSVGWVLLALGRYGDVTSQALYGRDINLYWDLRFIPDVAAMLLRVTPAWLIALAGLVGVGLLTGLYVLVRWAFGRVAAALHRRGSRQALAALAVTAVAMFLVERARSLEPYEQQFAPPVTGSYARQVRLLADTWRGDAAVPGSPPMDASLANVAGADVLLIFIESYGAVSFDNPRFATALETPRRELAAAIAGSGRGVVSAFVESPTFGGVSWLAHISLMSGVEVRDPHTNAVLMTQQRDTIVDSFSRRGYRTVAVMPGLWQDWPEGSYYGFDEIYDARRLDYRGPQFGWFTLTDQYALAKIDALEINPRDRAPLFVFFPTISTHTPFTPTPPYQADWARILDDRPYDADDLNRSYEEVPDWLNLGPGYVDALSYSYRTLAGYLRLRGERDYVAIVIGDHQPPAAVSGADAPWDVPVHVISSRESVLEPLRTNGFRDGLTPVRPVFGKMHTLLPTLLEAFGR